MLCIIKISHGKVVITGREINKVRVRFLDGGAMENRKGTVAERDAVRVPGVLAMGLCSGPHASLKVTPMSPLKTV